MINDYFTVVEKGICSYCDYDEEKIRLENPKWFRNDKYISFIEKYRRKLDEYLLINYGQKCLLFDIGQDYGPDLICEQCLLKLIQKLNPNVKGLLVE